MTQQYYNPFAGLNVVYPSEQAPEYQRYCQSAGRQPVDQKPFGRMVDLWFTGLAIAIREGLPPADLTQRQTSNMITGAIFDGRDSWRVQTLMLTAIAVEDDVGVVENPGRMMNIANGLAAAGVPRVVEMLEVGGQLPIWNLTEALQDALSDGGPEFEMVSSQ